MLNGISINIAPAQKIGNVIIIHIDAIDNARGIGLFAYSVCLKFHIINSDSFVIGDKPLAMEVFTCVFVGNLPQCQVGMMMTLMIINFYIMEQ